MSLFNRERTINFINVNKDFLRKLEKFQNIADDSNFVDNVINRMKLGDNEVSILLKFFKIVKIAPGNMFCSSTAEQNHSNKKPKNINDFAEFNPIKGTQWFTSCYDTGTKERNLGTKYNLSLSTTFLGSCDNALGRILIYRNIKELKMLFVGDKSFQGRRMSAQMITKMILGKDYDLNKTDGFFNSYGGDLLCHTKGDCECGLWNGYGTLNEFVMNYIFEIYCYDTPAPLMDGIIGFDLNYDTLLNIQIAGTEFKIFNSEKVMVLESVLYFGIMYYNLSDYREKIENDLKSYEQCSVPVTKKWNINSFVSLNDKLEYYCSNIRKIGHRNFNIFNSESTIKKLDFEDKNFYNVQMGGVVKNGVVKNKMVKNGLVINRFAMH